KRSGGECLSRFEHGPQRNWRNYVNLGGTVERYAGGVTQAGVRCLPGITDVGTEVDRSSGRCQRQLQRRIVDHGGADIAASFAQTINRRGRNCSYFICRTVGGLVIEGWPAR